MLDELVPDEPVDEPDDGAAFAGVLDSFVDVESFDGVSFEVVSFEDESDEELESDVLESLVDDPSPERFDDPPRLSVL